MKTTSQSLPMAALRAALLCLYTLAAGLSASHAASSDPPERMSFQGYLTDANGVALGDTAPKNFDVVFRIYNDQGAGSLLWAEQQTLTVDKGYFSVLLGEGTDVGTEPRPQLSSLFTGNTASDRFVETTVKGIGAGGADSTILPRIRLLSSPYALLAKHAVNAGRLVNQDNSQVVSITGTSVGINKGNPTEALEVNGNVLASGTVQAANVLVDPQAYFVVKDIGSGPNPAINFDGGDWLAYNRSANRWTFYIGSSWKMTIDEAGVSVPSPGTISGFGTVPLGGIIMWSGSASAVPSGWALCDGRTDSGRTTPDLRNRFIVGAGIAGSGTEYAVGNTGGAKEVTLTSSQLPSHSHSFRDYYFAETSKLAWYATEWSGTKVGSGNTDSDNEWLFYVDNNTNPTGDGQAHENRPPYYALAFIMRVK
ncbi:MAG: hypothetical protein FJ387_13580 [Verrucomicrobia bacterium]|nr:hypothetical protein [Verrucomicrobiota bacterium]